MENNYRSKEFEELEKETDWLLIIGRCAFMLVIIIFVAAMGFVMYSYLQQEKYCESQGGDFHSGQACYLKSDGQYVAYSVVKINGDWQLVKS